MFVVVAVVTRLAQQSFAVELPPVSSPLAMVQWLWRVAPAAIATLRLAAALVFAFACGAALASMYFSASPTQLQGDDDGVGEL
jgi:hypothetical protein